MLDCLKRAKEAGNTFFPEQSRIWIFPAETGHVAEVKEDGKVKLSHTGHALRHSFRTLAGAAGVDRLRLKILMNHALDRDVTNCLRQRACPVRFADGRAERHFRIHRGWPDVRSERSRERQGNLMRTHDQLEGKMRSLILLGRKLSSAGDVHRPRTRQTKLKG